MKRLMRRSQHGLTTHRRVPLCEILVLLLALIAAALVGPGVGTLGVQVTAAPTTSHAVIAAEGVAGAAARGIPSLRSGRQGRTAENGKGWVWQRPGASGNADSMRVMDPTADAPNGYVRFYNDRGQPIGLNGKPGPNSETHIPRGDDGGWETPDGWGG